MQADSPEQSQASAGNRRIFRYVSIALMLYGAVGVAVHLRLLSVLVDGLLSWAGLPVAWDSPASVAPLEPLEAHYNSLPWLPWAAWLLGLALLGYSHKSPLTPGETSTTKAPRWLVASVLLLLLLVGGYARMSELWPQSYGISEAPYDDEGVYAGASQLFLQGILPYRDYFFAHPPIAAISYAPALLYHYNEWGSPTSFMIARYLSVAYSLVTLALLFFIGLRLAGIWGGTLAGGLWALDGRVVEINRKVMLDGPMVLLSCAAVLLYLWARPSLEGDNRSRRPMLLLFLAGVLAALSALTKIAGVACLVALVADVAWLSVDRRRSRLEVSISFRRALAALMAGAFLTGVVVLGPFLIIAPSQFLRMVVFFQVLRASDGLIDIPSRIADLTATYGNALTVLFAALGFIAVSIAIRRRDEQKATGAWRTVVLWGFFSLLLFTYSRSFYSHYYIQLAAPLCLLGAGANLLPGLIERVTHGVHQDHRQGMPMVARLSPVALLALVALPLVLVQWRGVNTRQCPHCEEHIFEVVARYVTDAIPPGTPALTTDEQFNFLAGRPPSHNSTGYIVDSYGHMIYLGLGINTRDWSDLLNDTLHGVHSNDVYAIMEGPIPQADFLDRATRVPLIVIHNKGFPRLTTATVKAIEASNKIVVEQSTYTIYRKR